jgi:hypothetical protein
MNFPEKNFFTQNWCNIILKSDGQKVYPHQQNKRMTVFNLHFEEDLYIGFVIL